MDLSIKTEEFGTDDRSWLGSAHGTDTGETITLEQNLFDLVNDFPDGYIPSGVVVGKVAATGRYGPYDNAAADGREVAEFHLLTPVKTNPANANARLGASGFWHGQVIEANLPANHGLDAAAKADLSQIDYR